LFARSFEQSEEAIFVRARDNWLKLLDRAEDDGSPIVSYDVFLLVGKRVCLADDLLF
jgi:hypothetical protein